MPDDEDLPEDTLDAPSPFSPDPLLAPPVHQFTGAATGRYRVIREALGKSPERRRESDDPTAPVPKRADVEHAPWWFHLLDRFGFPTLAAIALAVAFVGYQRQVRSDIAADHAEHAATLAQTQAAFVDAIKQNTLAIDRNGEALKSLQRQMEFHTEQRRR